MQVNRHRRLYWNYLQTHPCHVAAPKRALGEAVDCLTWFHVRNPDVYCFVGTDKPFCLQTDNLISGLRSTVPFSKTECEDLLRILRDTSGKLSRHCFSVIDSYTREVSDKKEFSVGRTVFLAWLLREIGIPYPYLAHVKASSEYRGRLANVQHNWDEYTQRLVREYSEFLLIVRVLQIKLYSPRC